MDTKKQHVTKNTVQIKDFLNQNTLLNMLNLRTSIIYIFIHQKYW